MVLIVAEIRWKAFLNVKNEAKARNIVKKIQDVMEIEVQMVSCEKYWKDSSLFQVGFITNLQHESLAFSVLDTLLFVKKIGTPWSVYGPNLVGKDEDAGKKYWEIEGICDVPKIAGVHWIQFVFTLVQCHKGNNIL